MKNLKLFLFIAVVLSISIVSCKKDEVDFSEVSVTSEDVAVSSDLSQDAEDESFNQIENRGGDPVGCPTITWEKPKGIYPNTVTIDFGTSCTGANGRVRSGKIVVTMTDTIIKPGAVRTATLVDYSVDGIKVEGTKSLVNTGLDSDGNPTLSRSVTNAKITFTDGSTISWSANQTITFKAGFYTKGLADDIIQVSGSGNGINRKGNAFNYQILKPLLKNKFCKWFVEGIISLNSGSKTISIDYGDGTCDRLAKLTLPSGIVLNILLRP